MNEQADEPETGLLDAGDFLAFTARLRTLRARVDGEDLADHRRRGWHRRLAAISALGADDLGRAADQLHRLESEVDRILGD